MPDILTPPEIEEQLAALRRPLAAGLTVAQGIAVCLAAIFYAERAEKYEALRASNRTAQRKWKKTQSKKGGAPSAPRKSRKRRPSSSSLTSEPQPSSSTD